jgi:hypothetical protein
MSVGTPHRASTARRLNALGFRFYAPLGAFAVLVLLVVGATGAGATPTALDPTHNDLATIPLVATVAANSTTVFAQGVTNCSDIYAINAWGNVTLFATLPNVTGPCSEGALALAPITTCTSSWQPGAWQSAGTANWGNRGGGSGCGGCHHSTTEDALYDVLNGVLYEITQGGSNVTVLATFPVHPAVSLNMGLAWDQVGDFGHQFVVTSSAGGKVWLYNSTSGNVTLIDYLHTYIGGPAFAPTWFGSYGGDLVIAEKKLGEIIAVTPSNSISNLTNWSKPNAVTFPSTPGGYGHGWGGGGGWGGGWGNGGGGCGGGGGGCSFGPDHDVLFLTNYSSGAVEGFPASDLANFTGQGFIAGGLNQGVASFNTTGVTTLFASQTQRLSDIAFISCFSTNQGRGWGGWNPSGGSW